MKILTEDDHSKAIDHNKVRRAQTEVMQMVSEANEDELKKNGLDNVFSMGE